MCVFFSGDNGGFTAWSEPGECSRSCGGGIRFKTRTCTNPKPSLNGADCDGATRQLAAAEWCNIEVRKEELYEQYQARGQTPTSFPGHFPWLGGGGGVAGKISISRHPPRQGNALGTRLVKHHNPVCILELLRG